LLDADVQLLRHVAECMSEWAQANGYNVGEADSALQVQGNGLDCRLTTRPINLDAGVETLNLLDGQVVTASALLDLVSDAWLAALVEHCYAANAIAMFALTYDGRVQLEPREPQDDWIRQLVNRHQRSDKGFPGVQPVCGPRL
jgi:hypothetical protein